MPDGSASAGWDWTVIAAVIGGISAAITAIAAVVYTKFTINLFNETQRMRAAQTDAQLFVYLRPHQDLTELFEMVVENRGYAMAHDVQIRLHVECQTDCPVFSQTAGLAPGQSYVKCMGSWSNFMKFCSEPFTIRVEYLDDSDMDLGDNKRISNCIVDPRSLQDVCGLRAHIGFFKKAAKDHESTTIELLQHYNKIPIWKPVESQVEGKPVSDAHHSNTSGTSSGGAAGDML